jgi:hypothetical protein
MTKFKKTLLVSLLFKFITLFLFSYHLEKAELASFADQGKNIRQVDIRKFFKEMDPNKLRFFDKHNIVTNPIYLQKAAQDALRFFRYSHKKRKGITHPEMFSKHVINVEKARETLEFIINVIEEDKKCKKKFRILNPTFLRKHFRFIAWSGDVDAARKHNIKDFPKGKIRLTEYAVFKMNGSYCRTKQYPYALYAMVDENFIKEGRFKYSKQDIVTKDPLKSIFNKPAFKGKVKPLVWVSYEGLEEAMMQGTVIVKMPDKRQVVFTVSKNNGVAYDNLKGGKEQTRYWYFKVVKNNRFGKDKSGVVFAGDLYNIGLGKIIAIQYRNNITKKLEAGLGVLADSGGAFTHNLYKLDFFAGVFESRWRFNKWKLQFPNFVDTYILVKR